MSTTPDPGVGSSSGRMGDEQPTEQPGGSDANAEDRSKFDCNICLEAANDPVVSLCGHLYCWPCLHQWLEIKASNPFCPVCKSVISKEKVVPIYGKSGDNTDPRTKAPPRPAGQRTEDPTGGAGGMEQPFGFPWNLPQNGVHANLHLSFGFGVFPFSFIWNNLGNNDQNGGEQDATAVHNEFLSNVFLGLGVGFILWLLLT
ncbi:Zinc finger domain containing protein [Aphelenchoides fujianensis]|nr:Zinc finger domain containing protein [Aphelenchoides fujianensis]